MAGGRRLHPKLDLRPPLQGLHGGRYLERSYQGSPTPVGLFALYDRVRQADPNGFIGPWAVPLTAFSERLGRFDGGPGLVAIHGRAGASLLDPLGSAASHGCIRMNNSRVRFLIRVSMGTAVKIHR